MHDDRQRFAKTELRDVGNLGKLEHSAWLEPRWQPVIVKHFQFIGEPIQPPLRFVHFLTPVETTGHRKYCHRGTRHVQLTPGLLNAECDLLPAFEALRISHEHEYKNVR